jgi:hypothetical protein
MTASTFDLAAAFRSGPCSRMAGSAAGLLLAAAPVLGQPPRTSVSTPPTPPRAPAGTPVVDGEDPAPPPEVITRAHVFSWCHVPEDCNNITKMLTVSLDAAPEYFAEMAQQIPPGYRYMLPFGGLINDLNRHPLDMCRTPGGALTTKRGVWPEHGIEETRTRFEEFLARFRAAGGTADALILAHEDGFHYATINIEGGAPRWQAIDNDPRSAQLKEELGFDNITDMIWGSEQYHIWNSVLGRRYDQMVTQAIFEPARQYFPNIIGSNFTSYVLTPENAVPDFEGSFFYRESDAFGTHNGYEFFGAMGGGIEVAELDGSNPFGRSPFGCVLFSVNQMRGFRSSSDRLMHPWITMYNYLENGDSPGRFSPLCLSRYYDEFIRHMVLHKTSTLLLWNPEAWRPEQHPEDWNRPQDARRLNGLIQELNTRLDGVWQDNVSLTTIPWDSRVIATGLRVDDTVTWRFTFAPEVTQTTVFLNGQPIVLTPDGEEKGTWFTHPADQMLDFTGDHALPQMQVTINPERNPRNNLRRKFFVMKLNRSRR